MSQSFRVSKRRGNYKVNSGIPVSNESLYTRPSSADGGGKRNKLPNRRASTSSKPGIRKLAKKFLRPKDDNDVFKPKVPSCFVDDDDLPHRSLSPESPFQRTRYYSLGSRTALKIRRIGKDKEEPFFMWKPCKRKCEWESMSGRQLTISDTIISDLSVVEVNQIQRVAIARLQGMDIGVSFGMLKVRNNKLGKLSTSMRRRISNDRPSAGTTTTAVFGQPLTAVIDNEKTRSGSGGMMCSPTNPSPPPTVFPNVSSSLTIQPHPDQPVAVHDESADLDTNNSLNIKSSPLSPRHELFELSDNQVPLIVRKAIHYLDNNGIKTEGIFRVPGAKARIDEIRKQFDRGEDVDIPEDANPHDVACLFKEFFRSLPEPLMTRELYYPLLQTRKLQSRSQQKEALQLICLLLPRPNRDTLHELVRFLSRVALHSHDTILLDGSEESGNRMTPQNLAMVLGPNIIHNESKRKNAQVAYQITKADPEELTAVCLVMEDLIMLHDEIFKVSGELYDTALRNMFLSNHETVDSILKRKCDNTMSDDVQCDSLNPVMTDALRSKSSDCLRNAHAVSLVVNASDDSVWHQRTRSLSDTEKTLNLLMQNINDMLSEDLPTTHRRHSSNDSAMGESECITSPCQHHAHHNTAPYHNNMYNSVDSAISNQSSLHQFSSSESGAFTTVDPSSFVEPHNNYVPFPAHSRMVSEMSVQSESPLPSRSSPMRVNSPKFIPKNTPYYRGSLPVLAPDQESISSRRSSMSPFSFVRKLRKSSSTNSGKGFWSKKRLLNKSTPKGSLDSKMPEYPLQRSPLLGRKFGWEPKSKTQDAQVDGASAAENDDVVLEMLSEDSVRELSPRFHYVIQPASEVLI